MNHFVEKLLGKRKYNCNVLGCGEKLDVSGDICKICRREAVEFQEMQTRLDEWFAKYADSEYIGALLNFPIPKNEHYNQYMKEALKKLLHARDESVAQLINRNWTKKFLSPSEISKEGERDN